MIGQALITFREVLEAALITAIVLIYLKRTGREPFCRYVWYGAYMAVGTSLVLGVTVWLAYGALTGAVKALFEAVASFIAVAVLTSMIFWMATRGRHLKEEIEHRVKVIVTRGKIFALVGFAFIIVFREGLETVLFLTPTLVTDPASTMIGVIVGSLGALVLSYGIFVAGKNISIRRFFYFTSILLILLASGLLGYGVHELIEYNEDTGGADLGWFDDPAYDLGLTKDHPLHHKGAVGSVLAVMFGYSAKPEWGRLVFQLAYLAVALPAVFYVYSRKFAGFVARMFKTNRRP